MVRVREAWATRIGLILAVAGNAVGLGNFLRFPVQAASNGGGAFMIPYFISFILLGIPLMWMEWTIGRYGGRYGHHSAPGMFAVIWRHPIAKYLGALGLFISLTIMVYYTYIESWTLGYSIFSLLGLYFDNTTFESAKEFLLSYQGLKPDGPFSSVLIAYLFLLVIFAFLLAIRVLTIQTDPTIHKATVWEGLGFLWNPDLSALSDPKVWLAAAGQIFFTLSLVTLTPATSALKMTLPSPDSPPHRLTNLQKLCSVVPSPSQSLLYSLGCRQHRKLLREERSTWALYQCL